MELEIIVEESLMSEIGNLLINFKIMIFKKVPIWEFIGYNIWTNK